MSEVISTESSQPSADKDANSPPGAGQPSAVAGDTSAAKSNPELDGVLAKYGMGALLGRWIKKHGWRVASFVLLVAAVIMALFPEVPGWVRSQFSAAHVLVGKQVEVRGSPFAVNDGSPFVVTDGQQSNEKFRVDPLREQVVVNANVEVRGGKVVKADGFKSGGRDLLNELDALKGEQLQLLAVDLLAVHQWGGIEQKERARLGALFGDADLSALQVPLNPDQRSRPRVPIENKPTLHDKMRFKAAWAQPLGDVDGFSKLRLVARVQKDGLYLEHDSLALPPKESKPAPVAVPFTLFVVYTQAK